MSRWSCYATLLLSGETVSDDLQLTNVSFSENLDGTGSLQATMPVMSPALSPSPGMLTELTDWVGRLVIWPCRDGTPMGAYVLRSSSPAENDARVRNITAENVLTLFDMRPVMSDLIFTQVDQLNIARDLFRHATGQGTQHANPFVPPNPMFAPAARIPWLRLGTATSGVLRDRTKVKDGQEDDGYRAAGAKPIGKAVRALSQVDDGFEYRMLYGIDPDTGQFYALVDFGYPTVGTTADNAGALVFEYPAGNITSGTYAMDGSDFVTMVVIIGGKVGEETRIGTAVNNSLQAQQFPWRVYTRTESSVTDQNRLDEIARGELFRRAHVVDGYALTLDGTREPTLGSYQIGDYVLTRIERAGSGVLTERVVRILGWTIKPDDTGEGDKVTLILSVVTADV